MYYPLYSSMVQLITMRLGKIVPATYYTYVQHCTVSTMPYLSRMWQDASALASQLRLCHLGKEILNQSFPRRPKFP
jgi:hypothetical protein